MSTPASRGGQAITLLRSAGEGLLSLKLGSVREEIPADALPYLGRGLDPSLFSVAALQRAEPAADCRSGWPSPAEGQHYPA